MKSRFSYLKSGRFQQIKFLFKAKRVTKQTTLNGTNIDTVSKETDLKKINKNLLYKSPNIIQELNLSKLLLR